MQFSAGCYARQLRTSQPLRAPKGLICLPERVWRSLMPLGWQSSVKGLGKGDRSCCVSCSSLFFPTEDCLSNHVFFSFSQWSLARVTVIFVDGKGFVVAFRIFPTGLHGFNALPLHRLVENLKLQLWSLPTPPYPLPKDSAALVEKNWEHYLFYSGDIVSLLC